MPKIWTKAEYEFVRDKIVKAEGNQCIVCKIKDGIRRGPPRKRLIIEHADNDRANRSWSNLHLVCYSHNKKLEKLSVKAKKTLLRSYGDQLERERERENLSTWKTVLKDDLPYENGSPEMQANRKFETKWLRYVHGELKEKGSALKREIITGAAAFANSSIQTSTNYLAKYTSPISVFRESFDDDGNKIIIYRNRASSTLEEV